MYVTPSGSRIAHWWCTKEAPDHVLALLGAPKVAAQVPHHLPLGAGPPATRGVGLDILIQELPRVQFRAVGRQVDQPNLCLVALHPRPHFSGDMHWMAVHNQINLPTPVPNQATQKVDEHLPIEVLLEHPAPEDTLVGQGGDDVAPEALTSTRDHRGLSLWAPGAPRLMVPAYSHLITPVNLRPFRFGLFWDVRIFLSQPAPHRRRVLFVGPAGRFLGSQAPAPQRPPHPPYRESHAKALFNQDAHRLAGPQGPRQAQLVREMSLDQRHYGRLLSSCELGRRWATLGSLAQRCLAALAVLAHPPGYRTSGHTKGTSRGPLLHPDQNGLHRPLAQGLLGFRGNGTGILHLHHPTPLPNLLGKLWTDKANLSSIYRSEYKYLVPIGQPQFPAHLGPDHTSTKDFKGIGVYPVGDVDNPLLGQVVRLDEIPPGVLADGDY